MLVELAKLTVSLGLFICRDSGKTGLTTELRTHARVAALYMVPAALYALYNNLTFVNLQLFDPPTFFILGQSRLVVTGVVYQTIFKRRLKRAHWLALSLLTMGCMVKEINFGGAEPVLATTGARTEARIEAAAAAGNTAPTLSTGPRFVGWVLVTFQVVCAAIACVFSELLLKGRAPINLQNVFMAGNSLAVNAIFYMVAPFTRVGAVHSVQATGPRGGAFGVGLRQPMVWLIVLNYAALGLVTSVFLKYYNSVLKAVACAIELVLTTATSYLFLGTPLGLNMAVAVVLVALGVYVYAHNPLPSLQPRQDDKVVVLPRTCQREVRQT